MTTTINGSGSADFHTPLPVAEGGTGATASTGSGNVVLSASPTLTGTIGAAALTLTTPLPVASGGTGATSNAGKILQVVNTLYTGEASSSSATPADVSGFAATITPSSTSSKILVTVDVCLGAQLSAYGYILLLRGSTSIGAGTGASGNQVNTFISVTGTDTPATVNTTLWNGSKTYLDSPNTTDATTYKIQLARSYLNTVYINRQHGTADGAYIHVSSSAITLMEVGG
jgi:hypothetical protein|tara:strand:- start:1285 stop:1971 length:687 start_codon:yes stop_codon:yes gene_type:complete